MEGDQNFTEKLFNLETPEEVQSFLKAEEFDLSLDEINMLRDALLKAVEKGSNGELSDENLEEVAGGFIITSLLIFGVQMVHSATKGRW